MRILIAPDKFKGSLTAHEVCMALSDGLLAADGTLKLVIHPMADGGGGSLDVLQNHLSLEKVAVQTVCLLYTSPSPRD